MTHAVPQPSRIRLRSSTHRRRSATSEACWRCGSTRWLCVRPTPWSRSSVATSATLTSWRWRRCWSWIARRTRTTSPTSWLAYPALFYGYVWFQWRNAYICASCCDTNYCFSIDANGSERRRRSAATARPLLLQSRCAALLLLSLCAILYASHRCYCLVCVYDQAI